MKEDEFRTKVLPLFGISVFMIAIGASISALIRYTGEIESLISYGIYILIFFMFVWLKRRKPWNAFLFFSFSILSGMILFPLIYHLFGYNQIIFIESMLVSSLFIMSLSLYSMATKRDFRSLGGMLVAINIGLIVASLINIFLVHRLYDLIADILTIILFLIMILMDTSRIIRDYNDEDYITAAISIYVDFFKVLWRIISISFRFVVGLWKK